MGQPELPLVIFAVVLLVTSPVATTVSTAAPIAVSEGSPDRKQTVSYNNYGTECNQIGEYKFCLQDVWVDTETVSPGETVTIHAKVKNEGDKLGTISTYLGIRPPSESKSYPASEKVYDIGIGETATFSYEYEVPEDNPTGKYDLTVDIWTGNDGEMFHSSGWKQLFSVEENSPEGRITDIDIQDTDVQEGDTVKTTVEVENTGESDHEFAVGYSVQAPNGEYYDNGGTTHKDLAVDTGEKETVSVEWDVQSEAEPGEYDVITALYAGRDGDELQNKLDEETTTNAFTLREEQSNPEIERVAPNENRMIESGEQLTFNIEATDPDDNLDGVEWYIDGDHVENTDISGSNDESTWQRTFDDSGEYIIEAEAFDEADRYSDSIRWEVSVESSNTAPNVERTTGGTSLSVETGETVDLDVEARDDDGNLNGVEWYVNGEHVKNSHLSGSFGEARLKHVFDERGTYAIEAQAFDKQSKYSDTLTWDITASESEDVDAHITDIEVRSNQYERGDDVKGFITISNTGDAEHTFYVGFSVRDPDDRWRDNEGTTHESVSLDPDEEERVLVEWSVPDNVGAGEYDIWGTAYREQQGDELVDKLDGVRRENVFRVEADNAAPVTLREGPAREVKTVTGSEQMFSVSVTDENDNLAGIEWYINGEYVTAESVSGGSGEDVFEHTFDEPGTYTVEAISYDDAEKYDTEGVSWEVTVSDASSSVEITDIEVPEKQYETGEDAPATVSIQNTGPSDSEYLIGYSVRGPDGEWRDMLGLTGRTIEIESNSERSIQLEWPVSSDAPVGDFDVKASVWSETERQSLTEPIDTRVQENAFEKAPELAATIEDVRVETPDIQRGDGGELTTWIRNDGSREHEYHVRVIGIGPDGNRLPNLIGDTEQIPEDETDRISLYWPTTDNIKRGMYDIKVEVTTKPYEGRTVATKYIEDAITVGVEKTGIRLEGVSEFSGTYQPGETARIKADLKNLDDTVDAYELRFQARSGESTWETRDRVRAAVEPNSDTTALFYWKIPEVSNQKYESRIVAQSIVEDEEQKRFTLDGEISVQDSRHPEGGYTLTIQTNGVNAEPLDRSITVVTEEVRRVETGPDGSIVLEGLYENSPEKTATAKLYLNGRRMMGPTTRRVKLKPDGTNVGFQLSESVSISGKVIHNNGTVIEDATVSIRSETAQVNSKGEFEIENAFRISTEDSEETVTVSVTRDDQLLKRVKRDVSSGENQLTVTLYGESSIDPKEVRLGWWKGRAAFERSPAQHSNPSFMLGWLASGVAVWGDVRDGVDATKEGDWVDAGITVIGLAPEAGDAARSTRIISRVARRWSGAKSKLVRFSARITKKGSVAVERIDKIYPAIKPGSLLRDRYGLSEESILQVARKGKQIDRLPTRIEVINEHGSARVSDIPEKLKSGNALKQEAIKAAEFGLRNEHKLSSKAVRMIRQKYNPVLVEDGFSQVRQWRQRSGLKSDYNLGNIQGDVTEALALRPLARLHPSAKFTADLSAEGEGLYIRQGLGLVSPDGSISGDIDYVVVRKTKTADGAKYEVEEVYEVTSQSPNNKGVSDEISTRLSDIKNGDRTLKTRSSLSYEDFKNVDVEDDYHSIGPRNYHKTKSTDAWSEPGYDYAYRYTSDETKQIALAYQEFKLQSGGSPNQIDLWQQSPSVTSTL